MGLADYLSCSPSGKARPISSYDASFPVAGCRQVRSVFTQCFDQTHSCTRQPANPIAHKLSTALSTLYTHTRVCSLSVAPFHSHSQLLSSRTRAHSLSVQMHSPLRNLFTWRSTPGVSTSSSDQPSSSTPDLPHPATVDLTQSPTAPNVPSSGISVTSRLRSL